jgi:hypothetical protein
VTNRASHIPSERSVQIAIWTPPVAFLLCVAWSYLVSRVVPWGPLATGTQLRRAAFWATDVPFYAFGVPTACLWCVLSLKSAWERQPWQVLILAFYYLPALALILFGCIIFTPFPIGDL